MSVEAKAARVKLVLFDVDGVLTNGKLLLHADGTESKRFDIKDGLAIVWAIAIAHRASLSARARPGGGLEIKVDFDRVMAG